MGVGASGGGSVPPAFEYPYGVDDEEGEDAEEGPLPVVAAAVAGPDLLPALPPFSSAFRAPSAEEEEETAEGRRWKRPLWLDNLSLFKALARKPSPERLKEIIRRRQAVRRMPRRMDDNFLRTVSRKLGGNRLRIREFQLATDRYRNSLLAAPDYYDECLALFGAQRDAEEVLLPLMSLLPEASKRRGLLEEHRTRQRRQQLAAAGLAADVREGGQALGGWVAARARAVASAARAAVASVQASTSSAARAVVASVQASTRFELSWETDEYALAGRGAPTSSSSSSSSSKAGNTGASGLDSGTAAALLGLEAELSRGRYLDAPSRASRRCSGPTPTTSACASTCTAGGA